MQKNTYVGKAEREMALIKCPECGKEISDKAIVCPQCGKTVACVDPAPEEAKPVICEECGAEIPEGAAACPNCGNPVLSDAETTEETPQKVEVTAVNLPKIKKDTKKRIIITVAVIVLAIAALFAGKSIKDKQTADRLAAEAAQRSQEYASTLETASYTMLLGAGSAERACNLIKSVWYNAIFEERDSETDPYTRPYGYFVSDFNDALSNLFSDSSFSSLISTIETNQESTASLMKELRNPPEEYVEAYEAAKELYAAYKDLTNLATNPTGNLKTFSDNFASADTEAVNCYEALQMYID